MDMDRHNPHTGGILLIIDRVVVLNRNSWRYKWAEKSCLRPGINIQDSICTFGSFFSLNETSTITRSLV